MSKWLPIKSCPKDRSMFVAIAINVDIGVSRSIQYTSDPYCVWYNPTKVIGDERFGNMTNFSRWPHKYEPTHWMPLPDTTNV